MQYSWGTSLVPMRVCSTAEGIFFNFAIYQKSLMSTSCSHRYCGCASRVLLVCLTDTADHCRCASQVLHILMVLNKLYTGWNIDNQYQDKTAVVALASYWSVSRHPVGFKSPLVAKKVNTLCTAGTKTYDVSTIFTSPWWSNHIIRYSTTAWASTQF